MPSALNALVLGIRRMYHLRKSLLTPAARSILVSRSPRNRPLRIDPLLSLPAAVRALENLRTRHLGRRHPLVWLEHLLVLGNLRNPRPGKNLRLVSALHLLELGNLRNPHPGKNRRLASASHLLELGNLRNPHPGINLRLASA